MFHSVNDFFKTLSGTSLNWFWNPWFFKIGNPDLVIKKKDKELFVENIGGFLVPVCIEISYKDELVEIINLPLDIWKDGNRTYKIHQ